MIQIIHSKCLLNWLPLKRRHKFRDDEWLFQLFPGYPFKGRMKKAEIFKTVYPIIVEVLNFYQIGIKRVATFHRITLKLKVSST